MVKRQLYQLVTKRLQQKRQFIQVLLGPRQVGKTTLSQQVMRQFAGPTHYASADAATLQSSAWLEQQWLLARRMQQQASHAQGILLILDEIQKITQWSELVKFYWDEDTLTNTNIKVLLLGSTPLLLQCGLSESLAGRFEVLPIMHWTFPEMVRAFGYTLDEYIYYGGYPGAAPLVKEPERWQQYITNSLIETTLSRDVLLMNPIQKPALLRRLFHLGCHYSGQILSYQKMLGELHDAGNTTTLAHYLKLLTGSGLLAGLGKFTGKRVLKRASIPKLQVMNTALMSALGDYSFAQAKADNTYWGRLVESCIGAYLINGSYQYHYQVYYWRERNHEVDFVVQYKKQCLAIEVKSGQQRIASHGMTQFAKQYPEANLLQVGGYDGISVDEFLNTPVIDWFK